MTKKSSERTQMTARISVTPELRDMLKDAADGMGLTYEAMFRFWWTKVVPQGKDPILYGYEVREEAQRWADKHGLLDARSKKE